MKTSDRVKQGWQDVDIQYLCIFVFVNLSVKIICYTEIHEEKINHTGDQYSAASNCLTVGGCMIRVVCFTLGSWISWLMSGSKNIMYKVVE